MARFPAVIILTILAILISARTAVAQQGQLSAIDIYDGMIHYEGDQLLQSQSIDDYHCTVIETTVRTGVEAREIVRKDLYFMEPTFQLQMIDGEPAFYFDDDLMIVFLESVDLTRERDTRIDDVDCYAIRSTPKDPAFSRYNRIYYVAKDDFRHVRTVAYHSTREYDNLTTTINYTYAPQEDFVLLSQTDSETKDENGNVLATVTTEYTDYEFGLGLDIEWFASRVEEWRPNPSLN
jgi:hypothetical protein